MADKVIENNQVLVIGEIVSDFTFSHEVFGEGFYMLDIQVQRLSDSSDIIPLMVSERLLAIYRPYLPGFNHLYRFLDRPGFQRFGRGRYRYGHSGNLLQLCRAV